MARDDVMTPGQRFRAWVLGQHIDGYRIFARDAMRLRMEGASGWGEVNFYDMGDGSEIAEMRIFRAADGEQEFFLHFMMWTEEGNVRAVARYLLCNICTVAPDAVFVDAAMVGDLELLREELEAQLPRELIPELLMPPADFNELMLAGELALFAQRMAKGRRP